MKVRNHSLVLLATLLVGTVVLSACGGGGGSSKAAIVPGATPTDGPSTVASMPATFTFTFPKDDSSALKRTAGARSPKYLSSATKSISLQVTDTKNAGTSADIYANVPAALKAVQAINFANLTGNGSIAGQCGTDPSNAGNYKCTAVFQMPIGIDTTSITSWDANGGTGNKLSQQIATITIVQSVANTPSVSLDANASTLSIAGSQPCQSGTTIPNGGSYGVVGTASFTLPVAFTDPATKTIVSPGAPQIQVLGNDATYHANSGTINGTGGTVGFTINQSAHTVTFSPSTVGITNATVSVKAVPANSTGSSDGLSFSLTTSFTLSVGNAPPAHNFLAIVEQTGTGSGKVDFFNLGTDAGGPVSFSAYSPASLAVTTSSNQPSQTDVDNPVSLAFDNGGDLLIGNADTTGGNFACVPAGAISTGANASTTVTTNVDDPVGLAYEPRNGTVAIGNAAPAPSNVAYNLAEFTLSGNYVPSSNDLVVAGTAAGGPLTGNVINLPTLTTGTFAISLTSGCEQDPAHRNPSNCSATNEVAIFGPTGSTTTISDSATYHVDLPAGISYDSVNGQLLIGNTSGWHPSLAFYTLTGTYVKSVSTFFANNEAGPYLVAANGAGKFAIAYSGASGVDQVQVYTNNSGATAPTAVLGPITYNEVNDATCADTPSSYYYGDNATVTSLTWLSNTRLLVSLETSTAARNGLYIYDITSSMTPSGEYDDITCAAVTAQPAQKAFQQITNKPLATAFKP